MSNKNKQLTLLEKFQQGWEIKLKDMDKAVDVRMSKTWSDRVVIEWSSGVVGVYDNTTNLFKCTPPKERITLCTYISEDGGFYTSKGPVDADGYQLASTIHLEKNGDKWEVVNP